MALQRGLALAALVLVSGISQSLADEEKTEELAGRDFFDQATRSINHDKTVLRKLEKHPLAHASGWQIDERQGKNAVGLHPHEMCDGGKSLVGFAQRADLQSVLCFLAVLLRRAGAKAPTRQGHILGVNSGSRRIRG